MQLKSAAAASPLQQLVQLVGFFCLKFVQSNMGTVIEIFTIIWLQEQRR
jgi:hypothetical protein